ncbi:hypothetical protein T484DRAFT_1768142, partial [Baffinella frigidus]
APLYDALGIENLHLNFAVLDQEFTGHAIARYVLKAVVALGPLCVPSQSMFTGHAIARYVLKAVVALGPLCVPSQVGTGSDRCWQGSGVLAVDPKDAGQAMLSAEVRGVPSVGAVLSFVSSAEAQIRPIRALVDGLKFDGTTTITWAADDHAFYHASTLRTTPRGWAADDHAFYNGWAADDHAFYHASTLRTVPRGFSGRGIARWPRWGDMAASWESDLVRQSFTFNAQAPLVQRRDGFSLASSQAKAQGALLKAKAQGALLKAKAQGALLKVSVPADGSAASAWLQGWVSLCGVSAYTLVSVSDAGSALRTGGAVSASSQDANPEMARYKVEGEASPAAITRLAALVPSAATRYKVEGGGSPAAITRLAALGEASPAAITRLAALVPSAAVEMCAGSRCSGPTRQAVRSGTAWFSLCAVSFSLVLDPQGAAPDMRRTPVRIAAWVLRNSGAGLAVTLDLTDERAAARAIAQLLVSRLESYRGRI